MTHGTFQISWLKRSIILDPFHRHNFRLKRNIFLDPRHRINFKNIHQILNLLKNTWQLYICSTVVGYDYI